MGRLPWIDFFEILIVLGTLKWGDFVPTEFQNYGLKKGSEKPTSKPL